MSPNTAPDAATDANNISSQYFIIMARLDRCAWMAKYANVRGKQLLETTGGETFGMILTLARIQVLLVNAVIVMAKFVHENVQKHKCTRLRLCEPTCNAILSAIVRQPERLENLLMRIKIFDRQVSPQILMPRMEKNRARFLEMV